MSTPESAQLQELKKRILDLKASYPEAAQAQLRTAVELGALVRSVREQKGWSIHQLAKKADCNLRPIRRLESGRELPSAVFLSVVLHALERG